WYYWREPDRNPAMGFCVAHPRDKDYVDRSSGQSLSHFRTVKEAWWCGEQATPALIRSKVKR
ncbi:MAG: hypothetical protein WA645_22270, partial [Pseudolabrys sp.]